MKKLIFVLIIVFFPLISLADGKVIHIKADHVSYSKRSSTYYAYGNCLIYNSSYRLKANVVTYNTATSLATARGNILLVDSKGNWIKGTYAKINYATYKGYVNNATIFIKSNHIYIRARKIILYSKNKYFVKDGVITSCNCEGFARFKKGVYPKWSIFSKNTYVVKDDYIFSYPVIMRVKSVPVFFLPFVQRSLTNKRKSGFLVPRIGMSSIDGFKYIQPFFINLSPSQDITLYPFVFSRKGNGIRGQYRFYWTRYSRGQWNVTLFKEKVPYKGYEDKLTRINLKANQYANLGKYGNFDYDINIVNNKNNLRVINDTNLETSSDRYTTSTASYYISKNEYYLSIYSQYYQDLVAKNNDETLQKMPVVEFGVTNKKLYKNMTLDFKQTYSNDFRIKGARGFYTDTTGFLYYPFSVSYLDITPKVGFHQLYAHWENAPNPSKYTRRLFMPDYNLSLSTTLEGIYINRAEKGFKGLKHIIKPTVSYEYIPRGGGDFPDFVNVYHKTNLITFTVENSVIAKFLGNPPLYKNIFYNKLVLKYDFDRQYDTVFPPIYEEVSFKPFKFLQFGSKAHYFFRRHIFTDSSESLTLTGENTGLSLGYTMSRDEDYNLSSESVSGEFYLYPEKKLYTYLSFQRSIHNGYFPSRKFGFLYKDECYSIGIDFYFNRIPEEQNNGIYTTTLDRGFWITLNLTGLFSIRGQY